MLRPLYDWIVTRSRTPQALWIMAAISFAESSFFPLPPDLMLVPMGVANRQRVWFYALVCTIASVLGGLLGYAIGALLFDSLGQWLVNLYGLNHTMETFRAWYQGNGHWAILLKGLTPIPYKIVTITSCLAGYSLFWFTVLSIITRGGRFFLLAALIYFFGEPIREFIEKRLSLVTTVFVVLLVAGFIAIKYVF